MVQSLLLELHSRGIKLRLADSRLDVLAPAGSLTPQLRDELRLRRDELIALLRSTELGEEPSEIAPQPDERYEPFPLTDIQHAYWVGRNPAVELGGVSTHFYLELESTGLHPRRLNRSLCQVIDRHDMLRAIIQPDGRQRILPEVPDYEIPVGDLSGLAAEEQDAELARIRKEMSHQVLAANQWPLFDVRIFQLDERRLRLHISFDMLIIDGSSLYLVFHEWRRFYEQPDWAPEPLLLSYRDHIVAEESSRQGSRYKRAEEYWLSRLDALPSPPELPLAINPAQLRSTEFVRRTARVPGERWAVIKRAAQRRGLTPAVVLMTAYADVLRLWSGQPTLTLNLTLFNRPAHHPQIGQIIGDFTSVTLLAVEPRLSEPFTARADRLSRQLLQDLEHQSYSGVRVARERTRRLGNRPGAVMPVVFTSLLGVASDRSQADDVNFFGSVVQGISQTPQVWLDHQVIEERGDLILNWDALDALFPGGVLDDMFAVYRQLVDQLGQDGEAWDKKGFLSLPQWQVEERTRTNDTAAPVPARTLCGLVEEQASLRPDAVGVIAHDGQLSYREVVERGRRLARRLVSLDATAHTLVGVVLDKGCEQVTAVLGVTLAGAAYLPIDTGWPEARRRNLLEQCRVTKVITTPRLRDELAWPDGVHVITYADTEVQEAESGPLDTTPSPEDLAYVIFTSGSTGTPKGVMIDHRGAANTVQDINTRFQVGPVDRVLALSELSFDLSVYDIFGTLAAGGTVIMPDPDRRHEPAHWTDLMRRHRVTVWNSVPALMQAWADQPQHAGTPVSSTLRVVLLSGDWIPVALPDAVRVLAPECQVISLGGATEGSIWSVLYPVGAVQPDWTRIPYGKPLANQTLHVFDEEFQPCPVWTTGEIFIGGIGVAKGYWADLNRTAERFIIHPKTRERLYRTGDHGRYLPGGDLEFLGRRDSQVKLNGFRIELGEIAAVLRQQPGIGDAVVTVATHPVTGRRQLAAYVVAAQGNSRLDPATLRQGLEDLLPDYMVPHHYFPIDRIPTSANGKVAPSALPSPWDNAPLEKRTGPRDPIEQTLFVIWCDALERDDFGVLENFFELGGDSLHAVRILGRIRAELGVQDDGEAGLRRLFDNPTVASLATSLRECVRP